MKKLLVALLLLFSLTLTACSGSPSSSDSSVSVSSSSNSSSSSSQSSSVPPEEKKVYTIEELAEEHNARLGEVGELTGKSYPIRPKGGFTALGVNYFLEFDVKEKILKNVVAIDTYGDYNYVGDFLGEYAYAYVLDDENNEYSALSSAVFRDKEYDKLFMLFYSEKSLFSYRYLVLGGFEKDKNKGYERIIFDISNLNPNS